MPGKPCAVAKCKNVQRSADKVSFHRFPKDERIREYWVKKCKRKDGFNPETSRICSAHFRANDFQLDFQSRLLGTRYKAKLKEGALPSLNLKSSSKNKSSVHVSKDNLKHPKEQDMSLVLGAIIESPKSTPNVEPLDESPQLGDTNDSNVYKELFLQTLLEKQEMELEISQLKADLKRLQGQLYKSSTP